MESPNPDSTSEFAGSNRRTFLDWLLGFSAFSTLLAILYPVVRFMFPPPRPKGRSQGAVLAARVGELAPGSGKVFPLGVKPAIVIHTPEGHWRAFTAKCTHLSCTVQYREDLHMIWCPCHDARFDLTGKNVSGPAPRPLSEYRVVLKGDEVYVAEEGSG